MRYVLAVLIAFCCVGCSNDIEVGPILDPNAPTLQQQLTPVTDKWESIYDVNDLEVIQTYNIAALKAVLIDVRNRVVALEKYTYEPNKP